MRKNIRDNRKGSSLVEVLVAMTILLIGLGAFATTLFSVSRTLNETRDIRHAVGDCMEYYYTEFQTDETKNLIDTGGYVLKEQDGSDSIAIEGRAYRFDYNQETGENLENNMILYVFGE